MSSRSDTRVPSNVSRNQGQQNRGIVEAKIPVSPTIKTGEVSRPVLFVQGNVKQLQDGDFTLDSRELICLKYDNCIIVLFYSDNAESTDLVKIWANASSQVAGAVFGAVHLGLEKGIASNFNKINMNPNHPYHWARLQQMPYILVYREGWPVAFYNGQRATQPIIDYALTLACRAEYHEQNQGAFSMTTDRSLEMTGVNDLKSPKTGGVDIPIRTTSKEFTVSEPLRGFQKALPVKDVDNNEQNPDFVTDPTARRQNFAPPIPPRPKGN
jgi:hypothetical protein